MERMNSVVGQVMQCTLAHINDINNWLDVLPTVELAINSLPDRNIGYSPFFLNYGYHRTIPADLLFGNEMTNNETVGQFRKGMKIVWDVASANVKKATELQAKYCNERHKVVECELGDFVLLNAVNLKLKNEQGKFKKKFIGPFRITEQIEKHNYKLQLPN